MPALAWALAYLMNRAISRPQNADDVKVHFLFYGREARSPIDAKRQKCKCRWIVQINLPSGKDVI